MSIDLPSSDDVLERHQFYAAINAQQNAIISESDRAHGSVHRLHERMDTLVVRQQEIHEEISKTETRNKTIASAVIVAWIVISGVFSWMWEKSSSKVDLYINQIQKQEKEIAELTRDREAMKVELQTAAATRRLLTTLQSDLDELSKRVDKK